MIKVIYEIIIFKSDWVFSIIISQEKKMKIAFGTDDSKGEVMLFYNSSFFRLKFPKNLRKLNGTYKNVHSM